MLTPRPHSLQSLLTHLRPIAPWLAIFALLAACERPAPEEEPEKNEAPQPEATRAATATFMMSADHACALSDDGEVWCAGNNVAGQLGDGSTTTRGELGPVEGLASSAGIALSPIHNTCAWTTEGALWCWGGNESGLLGPGTEAAKSPLPVLINELPPVASATLGAYHACALTQAGEVFCWGENRRGQLGQGSASDPQPTPQKVDGLGKVIALSAGLEHTCALDDTGKVHCWGHNRQGALGITPPSDIAPTPTLVTLSEPAHAIGTAGFHTCAVTGSERALVCWGDNSFGQLGLGDRLPRAEPTPIPGAFALSELAVSGAVICFRDIQGKVFCAGGPPDAPAGTLTRFQQTPILTQTRSLNAAMGGVCGIQGDHEIACRKLEGID